MSRVGKHPVTIPQGVDVNVAGQSVTVKGKLGELSVTLNDEVVLSRESEGVVVQPRSNSKRSRAMWGTARALVGNMVEGVTKGFTVNLEITGVGYRAALNGKNLQLQLGYSHDVVVQVPDGIKVTVERPTAISITGSDRQRVGQFAAEIRSYRPPEPYKGKGIKYEKEQILRKEGKKK